MARTAVVTGGTGGIGLETAVGLAAQGYEVTVVGRNAERGEAARARVDAAGPGTARFLRVDLSSIAAIRGLAAQLRAEGPLDVLVNNVGAVFRERQVTADGIEATFVLSHLSGYLLTELLVGDMVDAGRGRIVHLGSGAVAFADKTPLDRVDVDGTYYGFAVYGRAKLANLSYGTALALRLEGTGVVALSADPGATATDMAKSMRGDLFPWPAKVLWPLVWLNMVRRSAAEGARAPIFAATAEGVRPGTLGTAKGKEAKIDKRGTDPAVLDAVLSLSARLCEPAPAPAKVSTYSPDQA